MASFDLFRNPFVLLDLDPSASTEQVADAFEDAVTKGRDSQTELAAARQALLRPLLRLEAEISCLLDSPRRDWRPILTALRRSQSLADLCNALTNVPPLSRANILAHSASRSTPDAATLAAWVNAQSGIKLDIVHSEIERFRKVAGIVQPARAALSSALNELRERQSRALFDGFAGPSDAIDAVTVCTETVISSGSDGNIDALSSLLTAYNRYIDQELSFRRERIKATVAEFRADPDGPGNLAIVLDALKFWNLAAKPPQLYEFHKSRSESNSQAVFQDIRNLAVELANEHSRFDLALSLTKACQNEFSNLPRAREQLVEDENTLNDRIVASKVDVLATAIGKFDDDVHALAADLRRYGFGKNTSGVVKPLRNAFITAVQNSKGSTAEGLPWLMVRSLVVKLNNDIEDTDSALALMKGLMELSSELEVPGEVLTRLDEDKRAIERNGLEKSLVGHLQANRTGDALAVIENLLRDYKSPEERDTLQKLKWKLEGKRTGQYLRWGFWAAVVVGGIVFANMDHSPSAPVQEAPSYPYDQATATSPVRSFAEEMPPVGTGRSFSESNIRYCEFQKARLDFIQPKLLTNFEITEFNRLVDDFNSRCSNYRYLPSERSSVQSELAQKQSELQQQAQRMLDGWSAER